MPTSFRARERALELPPALVIGAALEIGVPRGRNREGAVVLLCSLSNAKVRSPHLLAVADLVEDLSRPDSL